MKNMVLGFGLVLVMFPGCRKSAAEKPAVASDSINVATIHLPTLKCKTCIHTISNALASVDGIESTDISLETKNAAIQYVPARLDVGKIDLAISQAGYDADTVKRDSTAYENLPQCCK